MQANKLLDFVIERADERLRRRAEKEIQRKTATKKARLPGKLADCTDTAAEGSELFIVEGDSAGGSATGARSRSTQAILPLRGKILNVASATKDKLTANAQLADLIQAIGCGTGAHYREEDLRYARVIIMTDADVDGAHIASLLITFFYRTMQPLIDQGHLYLAVPPLYRLTHGSKTVYARDEADKGSAVEERVQCQCQGRGRPVQGAWRDDARPIEGNRDRPAKRTLLRVVLLTAARTHRASRRHPCTASTPAASPARRTCPGNCGHRPSPPGAGGASRAKFTAAATSEALRAATAQALGREIQASAQPDVCVSSA